MLKLSSPMVLTASLHACASGTAGARPHDMSAAQHQAAAMKEETIGEAHVAQYVPDARIARERCSGGGGGPARGLNAGFEGACWSSFANPTAEHLDHAKTYRKMAADHRAASAALQYAEATACTGLSPDDRDMSPFAHLADVASVEPLFAGGPYGKSTTIEGAIVGFRALPGMTGPWLQRLVNCHLTRNAALGHDVPEMPYCPLVPKGVRATVAATDTGFAVYVRGDDADTAREVLRRAKLLVHENAGESPATSR